MKIESDPNSTVLSGQQAVITSDGYSTTKRESEVVALEGGGYVIIWRERVEGRFNSFYENIFFQVYDTNGYKSGDETLVGYLQQYQNRDLERGSVVALNNGNFAITRNIKTYTTSYYLTTTVYDSEGNSIGGTSIEDTRALSYPVKPEVTSLQNGGYLVAWNSYDSATGSSVIGEIFDNNGSLRNSFNFIAGPLNVSLDELQVTGLSDGGFVAIWQVSKQLHVQRLDNEGNKIGSETILDGEVENGSFRDADVTALSNGDMVVLWSDIGGIYGNRLDNQGNKLGITFLIESSVQGKPMVTDLDDGGFLVAWTLGQQDGDIYAQRFSAEGIKMGEELKVNEITTGQQTISSITTLNNGDVYVTWNSNHQYDNPSWTSGQRIAIGIDDLHITFNDVSNDQIIINNWSENGRIENFQLADGTILNDVDVNNLISDGSHINQAPQAQDDNVTTDEDQALVITPTSLLGNDSDADGDSLSISSVVNAVNGTVILDNDGNIVFTPEANFNGLVHRPVSPYKTEQCRFSK